MPRADRQPLQFRPESADEPARAGACPARPRETRRRLRFLRADAQHLPDLPPRDRRADPPARRQSVPPQALSGARPLRGARLRRRGGLYRVGALQQAGHPAAAIHHARGGRLPARLRPLPRPPAARLRGHRRGELGLQHGLPALLRRRGSRLQPDAGGGRGHPGPLRRHRGRPAGRAVLRGRAVDPPRDRADAAGGEGARHPARDAEHERAAYRPRRHLPRRSTSSSTASRPRRSGSFVARPTCCRRSCAPSTAWLPSAATSSSCPPWSGA
jgi:hypothetical protein